MSHKTTPPRTEGSNPSLSATSLPGENPGQAGQNPASPPELGAFNLPLNRAEFVHQLAAGVPCEVPRRALFPWLRYLESLCSTAVSVHVACDKSRAWVTPVTIILKQKGAAA